MNHKISKGGQDMQKRKNLYSPGGVHPTDGFDKSSFHGFRCIALLSETVTILSEQSFGGKCSFLVGPEII